MEKSGGKRGGGGRGGGGRGRDRAYSVGGSSSKEEEESVRPEDQLVPIISYTRPPPLTRQERNYAVLDLNGSAMEVRYRWRRTVLKYRLWCFNTSNLRYQFGDPNRRCCTLPDARHFLIYMHCDGKWLCAVIDGASGYLDGCITRSSGRTINDLRVRESRELLLGSQYIQHAKKMPWDGGYANGMYSKCGHLSLVRSFHVLHNHVDGKVPGPNNLEVISAGETFILHFPEAGRSDDLYEDNILQNFRAGKEVGKNPIEAAREWKSSCATIYRALGIKDAEFDDKPKVTRHTSASERVVTYGDVEKAKIALKDTRLLHRPKHKHGYFYLDKMPMHLLKEGPADPKWAQDELKDSHELDLDNPDWGFLMQRFPAFPSPNKGSTQTVLRNAYIRTKDAMINNGIRATDLAPILDLDPTKPGDIDKHIVAYHESGHAIVALHTPGANPIDKATILCQGSTLGMVTQLASRDDASSIGMEQLMARLDVCLGGRVAEELIFGERSVTCGAENDLTTARELAHMVSNFCKSDMADKVHVEKSPRAGETQEVDKLLEESYRRVKLLLKEHEKELEAVANGLLEQETLSKDMVLNIVQQHQPQQDT